MQAAFAVIIWLMARLSRKECTDGGHHSHRRPRLEPRRLARRRRHSLGPWHRHAMDGVSRVRLAGAAGQLLRHRDLVVHPVPRPSGRPCLHLAVVSAGGDDLVSVDLRHGQHAAALHARPPGDGRGHQRLVPLRDDLPVLHAGGTGHRLLSRAESHRPPGLQLLAGETRFLVAGDHRSVGGHAETRGCAGSVFPALSRSGRHRVVVHPGLRRRHQHHPHDALESARRSRPVRRCVSPSPASPA